MEPGYSKILLNEYVLPDTNCSSYMAAGDINMMAVAAGRERSRREWVELLDSVTLKKTRFWDSPDDEDDEGVIEVML